MFLSLFEHGFEKHDFILKIQIRTYLKSEYINVLWTRFSTPEENRIIRSQNLFTRVETLTCLDKPMEPLDPGVVLDQCGYDFIPAIAGPLIWGN